MKYSASFKIKIEIFFNFLWDSALRVYRHRLVTAGIQNRGQNFMEKATQLENDIDYMRAELRQEHIGRLRCGDCQIDPGLVFIDLRSNFERMGDYCYNIAEAVAGLK